MEKEKTPRTAWWAPYLVLLLVAMLLGGGYTFATCPGVLYSDSFLRIETAQRLVTGEALVPFDSFLNVFPSLVMALCYFVTYNIAVYTWLQATFFLWTLLVFCRYFFSGWGRWASSLLLMTSPLIIGYSVFVEMNVLALAFLLWLILLDDVWEKHLRGNVSRWQAAGYLLLYWAFAVCTVGYRLNAATALAGLFLWQAGRCVRKRIPVGELCRRAAVFVSAIVLVFALPRLMGLTPTSNAGIGCLWETACMLTEIGPGQGYDTYLDDLAGQEITADVFEVENGTATMHQYGIPYYDIVVEKDYRLLQSKFLALVKKYPQIYLKIKARIVLNNFKTLKFMQFNYNELGHMERFPFSDSIRREQFFGEIDRYMTRNVWLCTPWIVFLLAALLLLGRLLTGRTGLSLKLFFIAACYMGAFLITTQDYEFRYFFPTCLLLLFSAGLSAEAMAQALWKHIRGASGVVP